MSPEMVDLSSRTEAHKQLKDVQRRTHAAHTLFNNREIVLKWRENENTPGSHTAWSLHKPASSFASPSLLLESSQRLMSKQRKQK